jgi:hypothetical protein
MIQELCQFLLCISQLLKLLSLDRVLMIGRLGHFPIVSIVALVAPLEKEFPPHRETIGCNYRNLLNWILSVFRIIELINEPILV